MRKGNVIKMNGFKDFITQYRGAIIGVIIAILIISYKVHDLILAIVVLVLGAFIRKLCTTK